MIKSLFGMLLVGLWLLASGAAWADQATVFVYHRFGDARYPSTNISIEVFERQLAYLQQQQYQVLTLGEIVERMAAGEALPQRCVALTVDDAYESFLTGAMPVLRRYGYRATLFVNTDSVGAGSYLDWTQLRALAQEGIEIGNHSAAHPYFVSRQYRDPGGWQVWARGDIERAQQAFKQQLDLEPALFAYPYGEYSPQLAELIEQLGYRAAVAQQSGVLTSSLPRYHLPRFPMGGPFATFDGFLSKLNMAPMPLTVVSPTGPVIAKQDPPVLRFKLDAAKVVLSSLRCYVQGQEAVSVQVVDEAAGLYEVVARDPLAGRRNKYTLTAQRRDGQGWYWFSQLWLKP